MKRFLTTVAFGLIMAAIVVGPAFAQQEAHYEGYFVNSMPATGATAPHIIKTMSVTTAGPTGGRGLVTALYPPLVSSFTTNEYTWVMDGLLRTGENIVGTTHYFTYDVSSWPASFTMYEDPSQDARPTFYDCPADVLANDPRYANGNAYLKGHFVSFVSQYDTGSQSGTFTGRINWDSGTHLNDLGADKHGVYTFGGTTNNAFACIPTLKGYDQAMTGIMTQITTAAPSKTWGDLRKMYK